MVIILLLFQCKAESFRWPRCELSPVLEVVLRGGHRPRRTRGQQQHAATLQGRMGQHKRVSSKLLVQIL
jgi:hypothetical protein